MPQALGEFIFVLHTVKDEETTKSGIIVKYDDKKRDGNAVYLAEGSFVSQGGQVKMRLKEGMKLLYNYYDAGILVDGDKEYHSIHEKHIRGTVC